MHNQVPSIRAKKAKVERSRTEDINWLLDAGVTLEKLEEVYPKEEVHVVVQQQIVNQIQDEENNTRYGRNAMEEELQRRHRGNMARLLFLRSKSTALKQVLRSSTLMDQVLLSLCADPEDELLMCPVAMAPLKDPVVISSGYILDRSSVLDEKGNLRLRDCPFSRQELSLPVYPCLPVRSKLKAWESERMDRCIQVAEKLMEAKEWERATEVFNIAERLLQEMGDKTYWNIAVKLAKLERRIPFVEHDVERTVRIHERLLRGVEGNKDETSKLLLQAINECRQKLGALLLSDDPVILQESAGIRSAFAKKILTPSVLFDYQNDLFDEMLDLYRLDLVLAKKLKNTSGIWDARRRVFGLLESQTATDDKDKRKVNKMKLKEFLKKEGLTGSERELRLERYDSLRYWPKDELVDRDLGLVRFDSRISSLSCKVDLNPRRDGSSDHWVEVAFRPFQLGSPSYQYSIFSQHGPGTGWEIRVGKKHSWQESNYVEAVWTTQQGRTHGGSWSHNEFYNANVAVEIGQWYHVVLSFHSRTSEVKLYVNGRPVSRNVEGSFHGYSRLPMLGRNSAWSDRQFKGMVAYASGGTQFPVQYSEADVFVQQLSCLRLKKLRECPEAMV